MKKLLAIALFSFTVTACHYGTEEAQKTLKANEEYKTEQADYSVNRANVEAPAEEEVAKAEEAPAPAEAPAVEEAPKAESPAAEGHE